MNETTVAALPTTIVGLDASPKLRIGVSADEAAELIDTWEWRAHVADKQGHQLEARTCLSIADELREELALGEIRPEVEPYWRELLSYVYASALIVSSAAFAVCGAVGAVAITRAIVQAWH